MTKKKTTKRALLMSALSLLMCVSMLIGSTFAWFTDSVTSTGNIIKSGTLDVEMYWAQGIEAPESANWIDASTGAIFNQDKWEPGYTEVRHIKIENKGSLALQYQFTIEANGEVTDLANVIDVYYIDPAQQLGERAAIDASMKLGTLAEVLAAVSTTASGNLEAGQNHTITLALKMQESAGNEYQGKSIGTDFSVILAATQKDFEYDSFGKDYDEGLVPPDKDGDILVEENGIQYLYRADGSCWLYYVTPAYAEETVIVPEGVTTIGGSSFAYNNNVKEVIFSSTVRTVRTNAFKGNTSVERIVLNEGLVDLSVPERAFNQALGLKEVVFPSTLKVIGKQAFALTAMEELTIPANVETLYEGAFRDMPNLKTVTIEGNTNIGNFAFRKCASLETVYLLGDDVTFAGTSQVFTHADTGAAQGITVFVKNETVAERLRAAQPSLQGLNIRIIGEPASVKVQTTDAFVNALTNITEPTVIDADGVTIDINALGAAASGGIMAYNVPGDVTIKNLSVVGTYRGGNYVIFEGSADQEIVFENCTFEPSGRVMGLGLCGSEGGATSVVYNNCTFKGAIITNFVDNTAGVATFNNCTFTKATTGNSYVMAMGGTHIFNGCTFDYTGLSQSDLGTVRGASVNSISESDGSYSTVVILNGCTRINCGTHRYGSDSTLTVK